MNDSESRFVKMPIVSAATGNLIGYEVLLRKFQNIPLTFFNQYPELYNQFSLPMLQEIFVLDNKKKIRSGSELLFINVTPEQFLSEGTLSFLEYIHELKKKLFNIVIEFTEHDLHGEYKQMQERMLIFKQLDCQFAIDDFGMNRSNFQRVFAIDAEYIKLDRSLIGEFDKNGVNTKTLTHLVDFCHQLNKKVIMEGIETQHQFEQAKVCGADYLQGYFYGMPEPILSE